MSKWKSIQLADILSVSSGVGLPQYKIIFGNIPVYGGNGINGYHNDFLFEEQRIIIGRVGEHCGNVHLTKPKSWITDNALVVSFKEKENDLNFWFYYLTFLNLKEYAFRGAQPVITGATIDKIYSEIPNNNFEQRKIARILSTADAVIEKTQAAIAKYKSIKQGMLHDLFTRGIDPAIGKLRPTYEDAPHLYKPSKLGWIPKEWEVETFSEVVEIINGGTPSTHIKEFWNGEIYWLSVEDFNKEKRYVYDAVKKISELGLKNSATNMLKKNMIIISARGTVGVIAQLGNDMAFNQSCYGINSLRKELTNDFTYYFLMYYKKKFGFSSFGSVFSTITRDYFNSMEIAFPCDKDEMIEITGKLWLIDNKIQTEQTYLQKLQQIKAGLMADLLTGKKKVAATET
jgi:type I restriction enzyme, S subunit